SRGGLRMTDVAVIDSVGQHPLLGARPRTIGVLREVIAEGHAARLFAMLCHDADDAIGRGVYLPTSDCPGRAPHHLHHGNRDFVIVEAVARRLKNDALLWRITGESCYRDDALAQLEAIFDD